MRRSILQQSTETSDSKQQFKRYSFYVFVDKYLGTGVGKQYLNLETEQICLVLDDQAEKYNSQDKRLKLDIHVYLYDIYDSKKIEIAVKNLKSVAETKSRKIRIMICGNESTLGNVVSIANKWQLSIQNIPIGMIPAGQYNDLSSVLGWGEAENNELVGQDLKYLKGYVKKWTNAVIQKIDIWKVEIQADQNGQIQTVDKINQRKVFLNDKTHAQLMISHLNIGVHARIGLGFDLNKGQNNVGNKFIHAFQSFKKFMCVSTAKIDKMVSLVQIKVGKQNGQKQVYRTLFSGKQQKGMIDKGMKYLDSSASLVCMNIDTYQGIHQVWKHSNSDDKQASRNSYSTQSYHDSKLQLVTFGSAVGSSSQKMCQSQGPIQIKMQRHQPAYIQIDNTSYKIVSPKLIKIQKHGRIQVLINKQSLMIN